jgi:CAAX prenyl protease-related protein
MNQFRERVQASPIYARVAPLFIFLILTSAGGLMGGDWKFWLYGLKVIVGAWTLYVIRPYVKEMRWAFSWEAVVVGLVIFAIWVGIDPYVPRNTLFFDDTKDSVWNPFARFGSDSMVAWSLIVIRTIGMTFVVPPLEEVFYRSFLYRYSVRTDFEEMPLNRFHPTAFIVISIVFGVVHFQWLAGIICGLAYQGLVLRKNRLGDAMTAHAITNFLLAIYVVWKQGEAWKFF